MIERISTNLMLRPEDVPPSRDDREVIGVFNPGVIRRGEETVLLVRVAERPREVRAGLTALPRWTPEGEAVDWISNDELEPLDPRVVKIRDDGRVRLTFISHLRVATSRDGRTIDSIGPPALVPAAPLEEFGVEDARITRIENRYYITYVAVSRHGAATVLASTDDFIHFERHGIIFCPENKDVVIFPQRIDGVYVALHRPVGGTPFTRPEMWIAKSPDLIHWGDHAFLFGGANAWESGRVGAGAPPIAVAEGWLEIYHGNGRPRTATEVGAYFGGAMLLDPRDPARVLKVGREAILEPRETFEREGFVANVVFPTGVVQEEDRLLIYYGASDKYSAVTEVSLDDVMGILG